MKNLYLTTPKRKYCFSLIYIVIDKTLSQNAGMTILYTFKRYVLETALDVDSFSFGYCRRLRECLEHRALGFLVWNCTKNKT